LLDRGPARVVILFSNDDLEKLVDGMHAPMLPQVGFQVSYSRGCRTGDAASKRVVLPYLSPCDPFPFSSYCSCSPGVVS
jgi:hypothetical protein